MSAEILRLLEALEQCEEKIEASKVLYAERDALTLRLRDLGLTSLEHGGKTYSLKDNFAKGNTAYRVAFIRHFEVVIKEVKEKK